MLAFINNQLKSSKLLWHGVSALPGKGSNDLLPTSNVSPGKARLCRGQYNACAPQVQRTYFRFTPFVIRIRSVPDMSLCSEGIVTYPLFKNGNTERVALRVALCVCRNYIKMYKHRLLKTFLLG
jgi:hypothetical protein